MRHMRCEVDEITGSYFGGEFEQIALTYLGASRYDVDRDFMTPMVMRAGLRVRFESDPSDPGLLAPGASEIKRCCAPGSGRSTHDPV